MQEECLVETKCITLSGEISVTLKLTAKLSVARQLLLEGNVVLLDRFQIYGKSIVMMPANETADDAREALMRMTELIKVNARCKNELLKFASEDAAKYICYEVENRFAQIMREVQSFSS